MDSGQGTAPLRVQGPDVKLHVANLVNTENCNARIACFLFRCREVALGLRKGSVLPISSDQADESVCLKKNPIHDHGAQLGSIESAGIECSAFSCRLYVQIALRWE